VSLVYHYILVCKPILFYLIVSTVKPYGRQCETNMGVKYYAIYVKK